MPPDVLIVTENGSLVFNEKAFFTPTTYTLNPVFEVLVLLKLTVTVEPANEQSSL